MAFIEAYRGSSVIKVSKDAYEKLFKGLGYRPLKVRKSRERAFEYEEPENTEEVDTIPISEMNPKQLKEYAAKHGIDISGANSIKDARRIIQKHIQESKM